jgi:hypothetical protein
MRLQRTREKVDTVPERVEENYHFDFNVGYLVKSPCRDCQMQSCLPDCSESCEILSKIQSILADSVASGYNFSTLESYSVPSHVLEQLG